MADFDQYYLEGMAIQQDILKVSKDIPRTSDIEKEAADVGNGTTVVLGTAVDNAGYHRRLGRRQIMMMTFGAGVGTGLYVIPNEAVSPYC